MGKCVTHLIVGLGKGGAETTLYQVLKYRNDTSIQHKVISFGAAHYYEEPIRELGIELVDLQLKKRPATSLWKAFQAIKGTNTLCCWMYHANLIGYYLGKLAGVERIVWCIRHSSLDKKNTKEFTLRINRWCVKLSRNVTAVAYNGEAARRAHEAAGYDERKSVVLGNGCDCTAYHPDPAAGRVLRQDLGISAEERIILSVTRNHPIKDIPTFLCAFSELKKKLPDTVAVLCGNKVTPEDKHMSELCQSSSLKIGEDVYLLGLRDDVPQLMAGCDLFVLHSASEAFPNVLIQAMACGCLCVSTDVGDAKKVLSQTEWVVEPGNAAVLASRMENLLKLDLKKSQMLRRQNRERVQEAFEIKRVVKDYEELF